MKKLVLTIALMAVLLVGCAGAPAIIELEPESAPIITQPEPQVTQEDETYSSITVGTYSDITYVDDKGMPEPQEGFWLYGNAVKFDGVFPGWSGTVPLTIINGTDRDRLFIISLRTSLKTKEGFEPLPQEYFYWVTIAKPEVSIAKGETYQVPITLTMPSDADYRGKKAEVRILVEDATQTGLVRIALEMKWFIITAD